jgi:hypothetical protein
MIKDSDQLTRKEAAAAIGVPPSILNNLAKRKEGPPFRKYTGKIIRYTRSELMQWSDQQLVMARE